MEEVEKILVPVTVIRELEKHWHEQEIIFRAIEKWIKEASQK